MRTKVVKKVMLTCGGSWDYGCQLAFMVDHENHVVEFEIVKGGNPDAIDFVNLCLQDKDIYQEICYGWDYREKRKYPFYFKSREGMSGCIDLNMYVSMAGHEWAREINSKKVSSLHISCIGKISNVPDFFSGDLAEMIVELDRIMKFNPDYTRKIEYLKCKGVKNR